MYILFLTQVQQSTSLNIQLKTSSQLYMTMILTSTIIGFISYLH